ncbi:MAG: hypothetical protein Q3965_04090 [Rothia sp. (in: high G+C Gram-positive bacteria)]|nr:hypothetical protein [Rothia sp. (in: high G+C Gram-positive bacteria)]
MKKKTIPLVVTVLVLLALPLPFAMVLSGVNLFTEGAAAASKEFLVSYLFGLATLLAGLGWYLWKEKH